MTPQDLFSQSAGQDHQPLAARMRPTSLDEILGQAHLLGPSSLLRHALQAGRLPSLILYGPPGCGKTTLAMVLAAQTDSHFEPLSAVTSGVADFRRVAQEAEDRRRLQRLGTVVLIDEIHRLNKAQQDALLPHVEQGTFVLIGTTTENPYFSVITPLLSRTRLLTLHSLTPDDLSALVRRALADPERGLGRQQVEVEPEALEHLTTLAAGDARVALTTLDLAGQMAPLGEGGRKRVTTPLVEEALQQPLLRYDRAATEHYDTISAYIKSMRGSDPDAALYWLAKMLEAGEDPRFIARRLVIQAAEDVGLADPTALQVAVAAAHAVEYVGLPEAQIPLALATLHLAIAPKSNTAYVGIRHARQWIQEHGAEPVPPALAGGPRPEQSPAKYLYPHDYPGGWVAQEYLPPPARGQVFYQPGNNPREQRIATYLEQLRRPPAGAPPTSSKEEADESQHQEGRLADDPGGSG